MQDPGRDKRTFSGNGRHFPEAAVIFRKSLSALRGTVNVTLAKLNPVRYTCVIRDPEIIRKNRKKWSCAFPEKADDLNAVHEPA